MKDSRDVLHSQVIQLLCSLNHSTLEMMSFTSNRWIAFGSVDGYVQDGRALSVKVEDRDSAGFEGNCQIITLSDWFEFLGWKRCVAEMLGYPCGYFPSWLRPIKSFTRARVLWMSDLVLNLRESHVLFLICLEEQDPGKWQYSRKFMVDLEEYVRKFLNWL